MQHAYSLHFSLGDMDCLLLAVTPQLVRANSPFHPYYSHQHPAFELFYVSDGQYELRVGMQNHTVERGQVILIPPGVYHSTRRTHGGIMSVIFKLTPPEQLKKYTNSHLISSTLHAAPTVPVDVNARIGGLALISTLDQIRTLVERHTGQYVLEEELRALSMILVLELFQRLSSYAPQKSTSSADTYSRYSFIIDEFFASHFSINNGNELLAQNLCVSTRQLDRILRKSYGMSYREKLLEVRLAVAIDFLQTTDKSITEIATLVGYSNPTNFSTFIKNATGKTPSEIRKAAAEPLGSAPLSSLAE